MVATLEKTGIRLFTGDYCPFCSRVRNADADMREEVIRLSGQRAIPILTIGDEVLVDSSHIIRELRNRYA
jgi:glutaredoxin 3